MAAVPGVVVVVGSIMTAIYWVINRRNNPKQKKEE
jgi:hypothetical protein